MGGMGFIENNKALCMLSVLINTHLLHGGEEMRASSGSSTPPAACVYNADKQQDPKRDCAQGRGRLPRHARGRLRLGEAFSERMCRHFREDFGLQTRVARYHNVYGPFGTWDGGREKAPAAICRKVIAGQAHRQARDRNLGRRHSRRAVFMYIDDCLKGTQMLTWTATSSSRSTSVSNELVTINQLVDIVEDIAGIKLKRKLQPQRPQGRERPQQRQHADPKGLRLGAGHAAPRRHGEDVPLDLRPDGAQRH